MRLAIGCATPAPHEFEAGSPGWQSRRWGCRTAHRRLSSVFPTPSARSLDRRLHRTSAQKASHRSCGRSASRNRQDLEAIMRVREIMSDHAICCTPDTNLEEVARLMRVNDCGDIPVVEKGDGRRPIGVITDRDITCRAVAEGLNPLELTAADCMSKP